MHRPGPVLTCLRLACLQLGANMKWIDVGGGLAVDYDGSFTGGFIHHVMLWCRSIPMQEQNFPNCITQQHSLPASSGLM